MNKKSHIFIGLIIGIILAYIGSYLYITLFTDFEYQQGINVIKSQNNIGKLISLSAIPNLIAFFILLKLQREMMARGIVLATIILALITLFYL